MLPREIKLNRADVRCSCCRGKIIQDLFCSTNFVERDWLKNSHFNARHISLLCRIEKKKQKCCICLINNFCCFLFELFLFSDYAKNLSGFVFSWSPPWFSARRRKWITKRLSFATFNKRIVGWTTGDIGRHPRELRAFICTQLPHLSNAPLWEINAGHHIKCRPELTPFEERNSRRNSRCLIKIQDLALL